MFLIDDVLRMLKADTDATRLQRLERDVKTAVYAAEQVIGSGRGEDKLSYALDYLTNEKGYDPDKDMLRELIEATVYQMQKDKPRTRKAKAETAEEFKAKYGKKRFTSSSAGKSIIYAYLYWGYLKNEGLSNEELISQPLYKDIEAIRSKVATVEDARLYNHYLMLEEWLGNAFETALFMRNGVNSVLSHFYSIASGAIAGEELRSALGAQADEGNVALWLSLLSVDSIRPTTSSYDMALTLRRNIEKGLRYLNVYNTLIEIIGTEIQIPELVLFQVDMSATYDSIARLNEALSLLRDAISKRETVPDEQAITTAPPAFTEKALKATLEAFREVSPYAPPIPETNIKATERYIRDNILNGNRAWTNLFVILSSDYWRR